MTYDLHAIAAEAVDRLPEFEDAEAFPKWTDMVPKPEDTALALAENTKQLGAYLTQMGQIMLQLQRRLDELEMKQKMQTLSHDEVLQLMLKIRLRAAEYCTRYELNDRKEETAVRAAIKKAVLKQQGIRDLHDCPQIALEGVVKLIDRWSDIRLVMKMREKARTNGT